MGYCLSKPFQDEYIKLFQEHTDQNKATALFPAFANAKIVHHDEYLMTKVDFNGLPNEVEQFLKKWRQREQLPQLFLIHAIFTNETSQVTMYLDYPESILTELDEDTFLPCLDIITQLMSYWQSKGIVYGQFGRDSIYLVKSCDKKVFFKILDSQLHPYLIKFYRKCWLQQNKKQIEYLLSKFYLSPKQFKALGQKIEYPEHNVFKTDVFCFGLFLYKCLTQDDDFYDFNNFTIKLDKIKQNIKNLKLIEYQKMFLLNMLQEDENERTDFLQLNSQINHFSPEFYYNRIQVQINDMIFDESKLQITQVQTEIENIIPEEVQAYHYDEQLDFQELHFSVDSQTNPTSQINKLFKGFNSQMVLNNNQSKCIQLEEGIKRKTRIDLPCLGYADLTNWKTAEGMFQKGMLQGFSRLTFINGDKYEGFFINNKANGKGTYIFNDKSKKDGNWRDNKFYIAL